MSTTHPPQPLPVLNTLLEIFLERDQLKDHIRTMIAILQWPHICISSLTPFEFDKEKRKSLGPHILKQESYMHCLLSVIPHLVIN